MFLSQHINGSAWGYGLFILETLVALGVIAAVGYLVIRWSRKRIVESGQKGRMHLVERLPLEHRRTLHLVEVDGQHFLIGTSEHGVHLLTVIDRVDTAPSASLDQKEASEE